MNNGSITIDTSKKEKDFQTAVNEAEKKGASESLNTYNDLYSPIMDESSPNKDSQDEDQSTE